MRRSIVYVCAPYRGTLDEMLRNRKLTIDRCRALYELGCHPIAPQLYYPTFLDEDNPQDRQFGLDAGLGWLLCMCDEVYVFGDRITEGMQREIDIATEHNIPIRMIGENGKPLPSWHSKSGTGKKPFINFITNQKNVKE